MEELKVTIEYSSTIQNHNYVCELAHPINADNHIWSMNVTQSLETAHHVRVTYSEHL